MKFEKLREKLEQFNNFILIGHKNADGDCIGCMSAFAILLEKLGKSFESIVADPVPEGYRFLPYVKDFRVVSSFDCKGKPLILFECATVERCGIELKNTSYLINFDHHPDNTYYGDLNIVDTEASSVGEMAALFLKHFYKNLVGKSVSNALYTAIHTDTGGFSYSNVRKETFEVVSFLMGRGLDVQFVCNEVYGNNSVEKTRLLGSFLVGLKTIKAGNIPICYGVITLSDLEKYNCTPRDTENFANYPRGIKGVEVGIFLLEVKKDVFKVSLRSRGRVTVNGIAKKFSGGGHKFAAGCTVKGDFNSVLNRLISAFKYHE